MKFGIVLRVLLFPAVAVHLWIFGLAALGPATLTEVEWSLVALVGVIYSADFLREAVQDVRAAAEAEEATRQFAEILLLTGFVLLIAHAILLGIGIIAMSTPAPVRQANLAAARASGSGFTLLALAMVLTLMAIRKRRRRIVELAPGDRLNSADSAIVGASR